MNYRILFAIIGLSTLLIFSGCGDDESVPVEMPKSEFLVFESYITSAYENEEEGYINYKVSSYGTVIKEGENDVPIDFFEEGKLLLKPGSEWDLWEGNESDDLVQIILKNDPILDNENPHLNHFRYTKNRFHEILTIQNVDEIAGTVGDDAIQIEATLENTGGSEYGYIYNVTDVTVLTEDVNEAEFEQIAIISGDDIMEGDVRITLGKAGYTEDEAELFVSGTGAVGSYDLATFNDYYYPIEKISFLDQTEIDDEVISIVGKFDGETLVETGKATIQSYIGDGTLYDGVSFEYPSVLGKVDGGAIIFKNWEVAFGHHTVADHVDMDWHFTWIAGEPVFLFSLAFDGNLHIYIFKNGMVTDLGFDDENNSDFSLLSGMNYFYAPYKGSKESMDDHYGAINAHLSTGKNNEDWRLYQSLENLENRYFIQTINDGTGCNYQKIIGTATENIISLTHQVSDECGRFDKGGFYLDDIWVQAPIINSNGKPSANMSFSPDFKQYAYKEGLDYVILINLEDKSLKVYNVTVEGSPTDHVIEWEKVTAESYQLKQRVELEYSTATLKQIK